MITTILAALLVCLVLYSLEQRWALKSYKREEMGYREQRRTEWHESRQRDERFHERLRQQDTEHQEKMAGMGRDCQDRIRQLTDTIIEMKKGGFDAIPISTDLEGWTIDRDYELEVEQKRRAEAGQPE